MIHVLLQIIALIFVLAAWTLLVECQPIRRPKAARLPGQIPTARERFLGR